jgi:hypothetical protein
MDVVSQHLMSRTVDAYFGPSGVLPRGPRILPGWVILMLAFTTFGFLFVMIVVRGVFALPLPSPCADTRRLQIRYTFGQLIATLAIIESPEASFEPLPTIDPDSDEAAPEVDGEPVDSEPVAGRPTAITSSFRRSLELLKSKGGPPARFRGFNIFVARIILSLMLTVFFSMLPFTVNVILTNVALANFDLAWTHIVISDPSPKPWYRRIPGLSAFKKVATPSAIVAVVVAVQINFSLPVLLVQIYRLYKRIFNGTAPNQSAPAVSLQSIFIVVLTLVLTTVLMIPATVVLTRVQASLLDDAEETIVPFDRSFGGKFVPEITGGPGVVGMLDAWKTFGWPARIRLLIIYLKAALLEIIVILIFAAVLAIELFAIAGIDPKKIFPGDGKGNGNL